MGQLAQRPWYIADGSEAHSLWLDREQVALRVKAGDTFSKDESLDTLKKIVRLCEINPAFLLHNFMWIRTKSGGRQLFNNWTMAQKRLYHAAVQQYSEGKPVRVVILKARQMGISTLCEGLLFWRTAFHRDATSLILAHEEDAVKNIFTMFKLYYESLPDELRPMTEKFNTEEIVFDNPKIAQRKTNPGVGSRIVVKTAALGGTSKKQSGKGRSATYHAIHASEAAFWAEPERFWGGISQGIPDAHNTWVFIESTANGYGNWFQNKVWQKAALGWEMQKSKHSGRLQWTCIDPRASDSGYLPVFLSWLEHPEYRANLADWDEDDFDYFEKHMDKEEVLLARHFLADFEQLVWRRRTIADKCDGDVHLFHQEYPTTPEEAFVSSGRKVFDMGALTKAEDRVRSRVLPVLRGDFDVSVGDVTSDGVVPWAFQQADDGPVAIYEKSIKGHEYVIGVDASYGKVNGDFSSASVLDKLTSEQVATVHGRMDEDQLGILVYALGRYYNDALLVIEVNGPGIGTLNRVQSLDYWTLYRQVIFDGVGKKPKSSWGWNTNTKSRRSMIAALKRGVRTGDIIINCPGTIAEMRDWVLITNDASGKAKEQPADPTHGYDDRITSIGIAYMGGIVQDGLGGMVNTRTEPATQHRAVDSAWTQIAAAAKYGGGEGVHSVLGLNW